MTQWTVSTTTPIAIVRAGDGPSLIINRSITNSILIGPDTSIITAGAANVSIIDPLGTMTVTGLVDVYAVALGGAAQVNVQDNALAWSASPEQIAAQIAIQGIPLVSGISLTAELTGFTVPGSSSSSFSANFTQTTYNIRIESSWVTAPADGMQFGVVVQWQDPVTSEVLYTDEWIIGASSTATPLVTTGTGRVKAAKANIQLHNLTANGCKISFFMYQSSVPPSDDRWRQLNLADAAVTIPGYTVVQNIGTGANLGDGDTQNLGYLAGTNVPATSTVKVLFPLWNGNAWFAFSSSGSLNISFTPTPFVTFGGAIGFFQNTASFQGKITLPRCPTVLQMVNTTAGAITANAYINAEN